MLPPETFLAFCVVYSAGGTEQTDVTETLTISKEIHKKLNI